MAQPVNPFATGEVPASPEFLRIERLPRRIWERTDPEEVRLVSDAFKRPGGSQTLRTVQAVALLEAAEVGGGFFPLGVGVGKTLVSFLLARIMGAKRPLLLVPAKLKHKTLREAEKARRDWLFPSFHLVSYELLSRENRAKYLEEYQPDLIVCDEAQKVKNPSAAVTRRLARYLSKHRPPIVLMSGTFTRKSLLDYAHLLKWAVGPDKSPLPNDWAELQLWSFALDAKDQGFRPDPGVLRRLVPAGVPHTLETIREGFKARLTQTKGVVASSESGYSGSLLVKGTLVKLPSSLSEHYDRLRNLWETPDGHPFSEAVDLWRHARELACGFYYRWNPRPPEDWLAARKSWARFVRGVLSSSRTLDSELQVVKAVKSGKLQEGVTLWNNWAQVRESFTPNQEAVWLDSTVLEIAAKWLSDTTGLCWVEHRAFGEALAKLSGKPYYGQGGLSREGKNVEDEKGACIVSIQANHEGRNLQRFSKNLIVSCPPSGATLEQLLGRTHRPGQEEDEVEVEVLLACREQLAGVQKALLDAEYIQQTTGTPQKLLFCDLDLPEEGEGGSQW